MVVLDFFKDLFADSVTSQLWVWPLAFIHMAAFFFIKEKVSKVILISIPGMTILMIVAYAFYGYTWVLAIPHLAWIPLIWYSFNKFLKAQGKFRLYLFIFCLTTTASLIRDLFTIFNNV